ncbi:protein of unknown function [Modestobacter italicus]|uniref:Uncharacterized protein n=1 Tax=Modestobacter italicus (strain DSM 44449 / CECT 9708 / BC 501) TaxID=2732864 RepID=I4F1N2_MODI5|nr:protein of unknown function [Modestobacter marinus]
MPRAARQPRGGAAKSPWANTERARPRRRSRDQARISVMRGAIHYRVATRATLLSSCCGYGCPYRDSRSRVVTDSEAAVRVRYFKRVAKACYSTQGPRGDRLGSTIAHSADHLGLVNDCGHSLGTSPLRRATRDRPRPWSRRCPALAAHPPARLGLPELPAWPR